MTIYNIKNPFIVVISDYYRYYEQFYSKNNNVFYHICHCGIIENYSVRDSNNNILGSNLIYHMTNVYSQNLNNNKSIMELWSNL